MAKACRSLYDWNWPGRFNEATASPKSIVEVVSPHGGGARLRPSAKAINVIRSDPSLVPAETTELHVYRQKNSLASTYKPHLLSIVGFKTTYLKHRRVRVFKIGSGRSGNADGLINSKEHAPEVGSHRVPALISASTEEFRRCQSFELKLCVEPLTPMPSTWLKMQDSIGYGFAEIWLCDIVDSLRKD